jgi:excisionase family DNA binding protein
VWPSDPRGGPRDVLTVEEAARRLACAPKTIRALIHRGAIDAFRVGRALRLEVAALELYKTRAAVDRPAPLAPASPRRRARAPGPAGGCLADHLPAAATFRR